MRAMREQPIEQGRQRSRRPLRQLDVTLAVQVSTRLKTPQEDPSLLRLVVQPS